MPWPRGPSAAPPRLHGPGATAALTLRLRLLCVPHAQGSGFGLLFVSPYGSVEFLVVNWTGDRGGMSDIVGGPGDLSPAARGGAAPRKHGAYSGCAAHSSPPCWWARTRSRCLSSCSAAQPADGPWHPPWKWCFLFSHCGERGAIPRLALCNCGPQMELTAGSKHRPPPTQLHKDVILLRAHSLQLTSSPVAGVSLRSHGIRDAGLTLFWSRGNYARGQVNSLRLKASEASKEVRTQRSPNFLPHLKKILNLYLLQRSPLLEQMLCS